MTLNGFYRSNKENYGQITCPYRVCQLKGKRDYKLVNTKDSYVLRKALHRNKQDDVMGSVGLQEMAISIRSHGRRLKRLFSCGPSEAVEPSLRSVEGKYRGRGKSKAGAPGGGARGLGAHA